MTTPSKFITADGKALTFDIDSKKVYLRASQRDATNQWWLISSTGNGNFCLIATYDTELYLQTPKHILPSAVVADTPLIVDQRIDADNVGSAEWLLVGVPNHLESHFILNNAARDFVIDLTTTGTDPEECAVQPFYSGGVRFKITEVV